MTAHHPIRVLPFLFAGLIIWATRFLFVYAFVALACARGFAEGAIAGIGIVPVAIVVATVAALAANGWVIIRGAVRARSGAAEADQHDSALFIGYVAAAVAALSIIAIVWETLPALVVPVCTA